MTALVVKSTSRRTVPISIAVAAALVLVVVCAAVIVKSMVGSDLPSGPLSAGHFRDVARLGDGVNRPMTWGDTFLINRSGGVVHIDQVVVNSPSDLRVGGIMFIRPNSGASNPQALRGWPSGVSKSDLAKTVRFRLAPGQSTYVVVELTPTKAGRFIAGPVVVDYHIGKNRYQLTTASVMVVCAPRVSNC